MPGAGPHSSSVHALGGGTGTTSGAEVQTSSVAGELVLVTSSKRTHCLEGTVTLGHPNTHRFGSAVLQNCTGSAQPARLPSRTAYWTAPTPRSVGGSPAHAPKKAAMSGRPVMRKSDCRMGLIPYWTTLGLEVGGRGYCLVSGSFSKARA